MTKKRKNIFSLSSWKSYDYQSAMKKDKDLQAPLKYVKTKP